MRDEDGVTLSGINAADRLTDYSWLEIVLNGRKRELGVVSDAVLVPLFSDLDPPVERNADNNAFLIDAFTVVVRRENEQLRDEIALPSGQSKKPHLRPQMRLQELFDEWKTKRSPRQQTISEAEKAVGDLIDYLGDMPVALIDSGMIYNYRDAEAGLRTSLPRARSEASGFG